MARPRIGTSDDILNSATPQAIERTLWSAANKLRSNIDVAEYKHIVLSLVFLKYLSDCWTENGKQIRRKENRAVRLSRDVVRLPGKARWKTLERLTGLPCIAKAVDDAVAALEHANPTLKGLLGQNYDRLGLDKRRLGELIDLIGTLTFGSRRNPSPDLLGRVYEYFLSQFARAEGRMGGQYYTPACLGRLLVEMLAPFKGRIYDPCCGSGGTFIHVKNFVQAHNGDIEDVLVYGQESNLASWRLAKLNLAVQGIHGDLASENADSLRDDRHKELKADYVFANPPFNDGDWAGDPEIMKDVRWKYGVPPAANANFAWVQHFIHHLTPDGFAGFVLTNGSLSNNRVGEGEIRRKIIEADLVDCVIAMPGNLFYSTDIAVSLWFLAGNKRAAGFRDRRGETLFVDATSLGIRIDRVHREITDEEIKSLARTYHAWRGKEGAKDSGDMRGFSKKTVTLDQIVANDYLLMPSLYVETGMNKQNQQSSDQVIPRLLDTLRAQFAESARLKRLIETKLREFGYDK